MGLVWGILSVYGMLGSVFLGESYSCGTGEARVLMVVDLYLFFGTGWSERVLLWPHLRRRGGLFGGAIL